MKIVVAQDSLHAEGGVESYLAAIIPALRNRGHSIALLFVRRGGGVPLVAVDGPAVGVDAEHIDWSFAELRSWGPDVCFSNNMAPLDVETRALAEWPVVKFMHGYFGTCVSALKTHEFPTGVACHRTLGPACLALYGPRHCGELTPAALVNGYRWARAQQRLLPRYATIVIASDHMAEEYVRHGAPRAQLAMLPLFPSVPVKSPVDAASTDSVLFLGRMTTLKGGDVLIKAVSRAASELRRPIRLVMGGDGPQRTAWKRLAARERVDAEFPGWLDEARRINALSKATVLAVPSIWPEPFGLVGLEAAARGVPAVAFDTGGIRQWLRHDVSGLLVPPAEGFRGMAGALAMVLDKPDFRNRMSAGAIGAAREMSLDAHVDALEGVLLDAAGQSHTSARQFGART